MRCTLHFSDESGASRSVNSLKLLGDPFYKSFRLDPGMAFLEIQFKYNYCITVTLLPLI